MVRFPPPPKKRIPNIFGCRRPRLLDRTSTTRRVVEKTLCKKVCVDFLAPSVAILFALYRPYLSPQARNRKKK